MRATSTLAASVRGEINVTVVPPGEVQWTRQFGTGSDDRAYAAAIDTTGRVFVAGTTSGALAGANAGGQDAFVRVYAADGTTTLWTRQFGTAASDFANGLATDEAGTVVVTGSTGGLLAEAHLGMEDVFVRAYDRDGQELWTRQFGTAPGDTGYAVAATVDHRIVVAGTTTGVLEGTGFGSVDGFVRVLDMDGDLVWTRQFGTPAADYALGVAVADDGRVLVAGQTMGDLAVPNAGDFDAFLRAYDADGDLLWTRQFGTPATDAAVGGVATDPLGRAFVAGRTLGALDGPQLGNGDAFVRAFERRRRPPVGHAVRHRGVRAGRPAGRGRQRERLRRRRDRGRPGCPHPRFLRRLRAEVRGRRRDALDPSVRHVRGGDGRGRRHGRPHRGRRPHHGRPGRPPRGEPRRLRAHVRALNGGAHLQAHHHPTTRRQPHVGEPVLDVDRGGAQQRQADAGRQARDRHARVRVGVALVDHDQQVVVAQAAADRDDAVVRVGELRVARPQRRMRVAQRREVADPGEPLAVPSVGAVPGERLAAVGVVPAVEADLVAVVDAGRARQREQSAAWPAAPRRRRRGRRARPAGCRASRGG